MPEGERSKLLRNAVALWSVVSATGSILLTAYRFLSVHGQLVPNADTSTSAFTIAINACLLTTALMFVGGGGSGLFFVYVSTRAVERGDKEMFVFGLLVRGFVLFFGIALLVSPSGFSGSTFIDYVVGLTCLAAIVSYISPGAGWIEKRSEQTMLVVGLIVTTVVLTSSTAMRGVWHSFLDDPGYNTLVLRAGRDFTVVPLASMTFTLWFLAAIGGATWLYAYVAYKDWRNSGKDESEQS